MIGLIVVYTCPSDRLWEGSILLSNAVQFSLGFSFSDSIVIKLFIVDETLHFYPLSLDTRRCFTLQIWNFTGELNKPDFLIMEDNINSFKITGFLLFFKIYVLENIS